MTGFRRLRIVGMFALLVLVLASVGGVSARDGYKPMKLAVSCEITTGDYFWNLIVKDSRSVDWGDVLDTWAGGVAPTNDFLTPLKYILQTAGENARYLRGDVIQIKGWLAPDSDVGYAEIDVLDDSRVVYSEYYQMDSLLIPGICGEPIND